MKKKIAIGVALLLVVFICIAGFMFINMQKQMKNEDPVYWEDDIKGIEARYEDVPDVDIVFVGSSSIRKWETLAEDFSEYDVVNHGFGGSKVADTIYYFDRLVTAFTPEAVAIFAGTNDIHGANDNSKTGEEVFELVKELFEKSQAEMPEVPLYYISISPTKARWSVWDEADKANQLIKEYADSHEFFTFIDTTDELLKDGVPNQDLFVKDGLHLNSDGYDLWTDVIKPVVTENIDEN